MQPQINTPFANPDRRQVLMSLGFTIAALALWRPLSAVAQAALSLTPDLMTADVAYAAARSGEIILVDIRRPDEWLDTGIAEGAVALDMREQSFLASLTKLRETYPEKPIAIICRSGNRSGHVVGALADRKFPGLIDVTEGMAGGRNGQGWGPRGLPVYAGTADEILPRLETVMAGQAGNGG